MSEKSFKKFLVFWGGQTLSEIGRASTVFALNLLLADVIYNTASEKDILSFSLAMLTASYYLAYILSQPLAGSITDKKDRKTILLICNYLGGFFTLLLALLLFLNLYHFIILVLFNILIGIIRAFIVSSFQASYVMIVPKQHLNRANGMTQTVFSLSNIFAPAIAIFFISIPANLSIVNEISNFSGFAFVATLDAITYLIVSISLHILKIPSPKQIKTSKKKSNVIKDFKEGLSYLSPPFFWLLSLSALGNILIPIILTLQPLLVKFSLSKDLTDKGIDFDTSLALLSSLTSIGGLIGGLLIAVLGGINGNKKIYGVLIPLIFSGFGQIAYGLSPDIYLTSILGLLIFLMFPVMNAHAATIWQQQIPKELHGRVFAVRRLVAQFTLPFGSMLAGWIGANFNPGYAISFLGAMFTLYCIALLFNKVLLNIEDTPVEETEKRFDKVT